MISARLDDEDQSLLDIACNLGQMTRYAADKGLLALGIDYSSRAINAAYDNHNGAPNLAFMRFEITPEVRTKNSKLRCHPLLIGLSLLDADLW